MHKILLFHIKYTLHITEYTVPDECVYDRGLRPSSEKAQGNFLLYISIHTSYCIIVCGLTFNLRRLPSLAALKTPFLNSMFIVQWAKHWRSTRLKNTSPPYTLQQLTEALTRACPWAGGHSATVTTAASAETLFLHPPPESYHSHNKCARGGSHCLAPSLLPWVTTYSKNCRKHWYIVIYVLTT